MQCYNITYFGTRFRAGPARARSHLPSGERLRTAGRGSYPFCTPQKVGKPLATPVMLLR